MKRITVEVTKSYTVELEVKVEEAIDRMLTEEWQSVFYPFEDRDDAIDFLATHAIHGTRSISEMDGWADCAENAVRMMVVNQDTEDIAVREEEIPELEEG